MTVAKVRRGAFILSVIGHNNCISRTCEQSAPCHGEWLHLALATDDAPHGKERFVMNEIWKDVSGFEGYYQVSNLGRVKSYDRVITERGGITRKHYGRIIHHGLAGCGYAQIHLYVNGVQTVTYAHRLVAAAFIGPCPDGLEVNHKNGNKQDNRVENLEYVTRSENERHSYRVLGRTPSTNLKHGDGQDNTQAKLTDDQVRAIRSIYAGGKVTQNELAVRFGISQSSVSFIIHRKTWSHI